MLAQSSLIIFNVALILTCSLLHAMKERSYVCTVRHRHAHRRRIAFVQPLQNHARYVRQDNNTPQSAREAHHDRSVRPCSSRHGRHPCLFRHSLRAGQLTVKGIARVQPVSFRPPC